MLLTIKLRIKDKHAKELNRQARAVNFVWNYCNETQQKAVRSHRRWLSHFDLQKLTSGSSKDLGLHGHTIQNVCKQYDLSRKTHKKAWLKWRGRKSLGWVPFNTSCVAFVKGGVKFRSAVFGVMNTREVPPNAKVGAGSFSQDARGRWYINMPVEFPEGWFAKSKTNSVGIDLGLKDLASMSDGEKIEAPRVYRGLEAKYGNAQRARKKRRAQAIAAKIKNIRRDHLHKASARLALANNFIVVGNVSSSKLAKTKMAKSVLDASWSTFRTQLFYKAIRHGGVCIEVNEAYTSQTCSTCGDKPSGRPKGIAGLAVREWQCSSCGTSHDRDSNAALNILRIGLDTLAEGTPLVERGVRSPSLQEGE